MKLFITKYKQQCDIGREYFRGDYMSMIDDIHNICLDTKNNTQTIETTTIEKINEETARLNEICNKLNVIRNILIDEMPTTTTIETVDLELEHIIIDNQSYYIDTTTNELYDEEAETIIGHYDPETNKISCKNEQNDNQQNTMLELNEPDEKSKNNLLQLQIEQLTTKIQTLNEKCDELNHTCKLIDKNQNNITEDIPSNMNKNAFVCEKCHYTTFVKQNYNAHILSDRHREIDNFNFMCIKCERCFKSKTGLYKHKKQCTEHSQKLDALTTKQLRNNITKLNEIVLKQTAEITELKQRMNENP
jgi:hypothetical protein